MASFLSVYHSEASITVYPLTRIDKRAGEAVFDLFCAAYDLFGVELPDNRGSHDV